MKLDSQVSSARCCDLAGRKIRLLLRPTFLRPSKHYILSGPQVLGGEMDFECRARSQPPQISIRREPMPRLDLIPFSNSVEFVNEKVPALRPLRNLGGHDEILAGAAAPRSPEALRICARYSP